MATQLREKDSNIHHLKMQVSAFTCIYVHIMFLVARQPVVLTNQIQTEEN